MQAVQQRQALAVPGSVRSPLALLRAWLLDLPASSVQQPALLEARLVQSAGLPDAAVRQRRPQACQPQRPYPEQQE